MAQNSRQEQKQNVIDVLNKARSMELRAIHQYMNQHYNTAKIFETIIDEEQIHLNYFSNVNDHLEKLGSAYLARIAGTPASTGAAAKGFVIGGGGV